MFSSILPLFLLVLCYSVQFALFRCSDGSVCYVSLMDLCSSVSIQFIPIYPRVRESLALFSQQNIGVIFVVHIYASNKRKNNVFEPIFFFWLPFVNVIIKRAKKNETRTWFLQHYTLFCLELYLCNCDREKQTFSIAIEKQYSISGVFFRVLQHDQHNIWFYLWSVHLSLFLTLFHLLNIFFFTSAEILNSLFSVEMANMPIGLYATSKMKK